MAVNQLFGPRGPPPSVLVQHISASNQPLRSSNLAPQALPAANGNQYQCSVCKTREAVRLCACSYPPERLCPECVETHLGDFLSAHHPMSIKALPYFTTSVYLETYKSRQKGVKAAVATFSETMSRIDEAKAKIETHFKAISTAVKTCKSENLRQLEEIKRNFESTFRAVMDEVEKNIYKDKCESENWLATAMWSYNRNPVVLTRYVCVCDKQAVLPLLDKMIFMKLSIGEECRNPVELPDDIKSGRPNQEFERHLEDLQIQQLQTEATAKWNREKLKRRIKKIASVLKIERAQEFRNWREITQEGVRINP